jgi:hypothetical protein
MQDLITHYYNCAGCLMTQQLQDLALGSMQSYTDLFVSRPDSVRRYGHTGFILRILLDESSLVYEPEIDEIQVSFQQIIARKCRPNNSAVALSQSLSKGLIR